jgi:hypothetical protein
MGTRKLAEVLECEREAVVPVVCWKFSSVGSGRNCGPTLLETHNEKSAAITTLARKNESLDKVNWFILSASQNITSCFGESRTVA